MKKLLKIDILIFLIKKSLIITIINGLKSKKQLNKSEPYTPPMVFKVVPTPHTQSTARAVRGGGGR